MAVEILSVQVEKPTDLNIILGQSHFIKTVNDLYEVCVGASPDILFAVGFNEASGDCLVRIDGNDDELKSIVSKNLLKIGASHCFMIALRNAYPINILNAVKMVPEVCNIYAATGNPLQVIVAETEQGRGVLSVVDGSPPVGIEADSDAEARNRYVKNLGYKR